MHAPVVTSVVLLLLSFIHDMHLVTEIHARHFIDEDAHGTQMNFQLVGVPDAHFDN